MKFFSVFAWLLLELVFSADLRSEGFRPSAEVRISLLIASDGQSIPLRLWGDDQSPDQIVLGVHGFSDYGRGFAHLLSGIDTSGRMLLAAYDQRGFGESASRSKWAGIDRLNADLTEVLTHLASRYPDRPIHLIGESMGAALIIDAMHKPRSSQLFVDGKANRSTHDAVIDSSILLAPAVWGWDAMPWYQRIGLRLLHRFFPDMRLSSSHAKRIGIRPTDDPQVAAYLAKDPLMLRDIRVSMLVGLTDLMDSASRLMPLPGHPSLVILGTQDEVIPVSAYCKWIDNHSSPVSTSWYVQAEGFHMLTRQIRRDPVIARLRESYADRAHKAQDSGSARHLLDCDRSSRRGGSAQNRNTQGRQDLLSAHVMSGSDGSQSDSP